MTKKRTRNHGSGSEQRRENKGGGQDSFKHGGRRGESLTSVHDDVPILVKLANQRKDEVEYIDRCARARRSNPVLKRRFLNHSNPALSHCRWRPAHRRLLHVQRGKVAIRQWAGVGQLPFALRDFSRRASRVSPGDTLSSASCRR